MPEGNQKSFSDLATLDHKLIDEAWTSFKDKAGSVLRVETIATHSGKPINNRLYRGPMMKDGISSWCIKTGAEHDKPFIKNHDQNSEPLGRVVDAEYKALVKGTRFLKDYLYPSKEGSGFTKLTSEIRDDDAIEKILDGRYQTVSVGGSTDAAFCSVCTGKHKDFVNMWGSYKDKDGEKHYCEHIPGRTYGDSKCNVITGALEYHEVSSVNVPADGDARHLMKQLIKDSIGNEDSSLWGYFNDDEDSQYELLQLPTRFSILDAEGNPIRSLDEDRYKSTKTISVPNPKTQDAKENESEEGKESNNESVLTDKEFCNARVLKHFSDLEMLELTDDEKEVVAKLGNAKLTDDQSSILDKMFMTHPSVPFTVSDVHESSATRALLDEGRIRCTDKEGWIKALDEQTQQSLPNNSTEDNSMADEAFKKALKDSQDKVEALVKTEADQKKVIDKLTEEKGVLEGQVKDLSEKLHAQTVDKIVDLRAELGYHDAKDLDEAGITALKDKYVAKSPELVDELYQDLLAQKEAGGFVSANVADAGNGDVENPLEDKQDEGDQKPNTPAKSPVTIKDSQDF